MPSTYQKIAGNPAKIEAIITAEQSIESESKSKSSSPIKARIETSQESRKKRMRISDNLLISLKKE